MLFLLYGEDVFRSKEKLSQLKNAFLEKNTSAEAYVFDFSEKKISNASLLESFSASGLFSAKKMIVIENFIKETSAENQKELLARMKNQNNLSSDNELIIIFRENGQPKKSLSFFKYLSENSKKQEFKILGSKDLESWILEYSKTNFPKISFSKKSLLMLALYTGNDLFLLKNEMEKLANFKVEGEISEEDIDLLVKSQTESTVFQTTEALLNKNRGMALKLFHEQLEKGEDLFYILSMYAYQIRTLLKIASSIENGNLVSNSIASETGVHPYVVQKSIAQARSAGTEKLRKIYQDLQKIDQDAKTGKTEIKFALDKFIAEI